MDGGIEFSYQKRRQPWELYCEWDPLRDFENEDFMNLTSFKCSNPATSDTLSIQLTQSLNRTTYN